MFAIRQKTEWHRDRRKMLELPTAWGAPQGDVREPAMPELCSWRQLPEPQYSEQTALIPGLWLVHWVSPECTHHESGCTLEEQLRWRRGGWEILGLLWQCLENRHVTVDLCSRASKHTGWRCLASPNGNASTKELLILHLSQSCFSVSFLTLSTILTTQSFSHTWEQTAFVSCILYFV